MFGLADEAVDETVSPSPLTHYGVFKQANEGNARVYFADHGVSSVGLRPYSVYGVGRDAADERPTPRSSRRWSGVRSDPFSGVTDFIYTADTAAAFIEQDRTEPGTRTGTERRARLRRNGVHDDEGIEPAAVRGGDQEIAARRQVLLPDVRTRNRKTPKMTKRATSRMSR